MNVRIMSWVLLLVAILAYPLAVAAGGGPRFPSQAECVHPAKTEGNIEAVFARFNSSARAETLLRTVLRSGFKGTQVEPDACGLLKVTLHGIPTLQVGRDFVAEAESVGFHPTLEQGTR